MNTKKFIELAIKKHSLKYDYSKVDYINTKNDIIIICQKHGEFKQKPETHLKNNKNGNCPKCAIDIRNYNMRFKNEEYINKL